MARQQVNRGNAAERKAIGRQALSRVSAALAASGRKSAQPQAGTLRLVGKAPDSIYQNVALRLPTAGTLRMVGKVPTLSITLHLVTTPRSGVIQLVGKQSTAGTAVVTVPAAGLLRLLGNTPTTEVQIGD